MAWGSIEPLKMEKAGPRGPAFPDHFLSGLFFLSRRVFSLWVEEPGWRGVWLFQFVDHIHAEA